MKDSGCVLLLPSNSLWRKKGKKKRTEGGSTRDRGSRARETSLKQVFNNSYINFLLHRYSSELLLTDSYSIHLPLNPSKTQEAKLLNSLTAASFMHVPHEAVCNKKYTAKLICNPTNNHKSLNSQSVFLASYHSNIKTSECHVK